MLGQFEWISSGQPKPVASTIYKPLDKPPIERKRDADKPRNPYRVSKAKKLVRCGRCQKEGHKARRCIKTVSSLYKEPVYWIVEKIKNEPYFR